MLRIFGDDDLLLQLSYGSASWPAGIFSALVMLRDPDRPRILQRQLVPSPAQAREIYYRVHGIPFNAKPPPRGNSRLSSLADFQFDNDHGGTQVGGRLNGLHLVSSRIDGSISGDDAVAYLEWTVEFRNSSTIDRETRLQLALPPNAVVSRATLWVNGEEREAAYGGRGEVRAAYQRVAVRERRDPLLVTTKGADRVMAQAFPVPRNGGTIKFKLGISAPLEMVDVSRARLTLPAIVDRNFSFPDDLRHNVWIEGRQAFATSTEGLSPRRVEPRLYRVAGSIDDSELARARATITVDRNPNSDRLAARIGDAEIVVQELKRGGREPFSAFMLVIDGSASVVGLIPELVKALDAIPAGSKVGVIIATDPLRVR
jgi:hypothetical protein